MYFKTRTTNGQPSWWLYGNHDEVCAWAGHTFSSIFNAKQAANAFKNGAKAAIYGVFQDAGRGWRWRAWRSNDTVAATEVSFASEPDAQRAADHVRDNAAHATGP